MDHQVAASGTKVIRHRSPLGSWEYAIGTPHPSLHQYVHDRYYGWIESFAMPICRREVPTQDVPIIINFGAPFRLSRPATPTVSCGGSATTGPRDDATDVPGITRPRPRRGRKRL
jgi:hypothetical protein